MQSNSFRTLYVEVYPDKYSELSAPLPSFRTLYVEVYPGILIFVVQSLLRFRTLYVEVYPRICRPRIAGKSVSVHYMLRFILITPGRTAGPYVVSVHYMLRFINAVLRNINVASLRFRTLYVEVYRKTISYKLFRAGVSVHYMLRFI